MNIIDKIFYINLSHREDRRNHIISELNRAEFDESKIERINAINIPNNGAYGCILSHIKALTKILEDESINICLVLEDDFTFSDEPSKRFDELFNSSLDWDIISLAYNSNGCKMIDSGIPNFLKVIKHGTTSGYMLKRCFVVKLLDNFNECKMLMETHGRQHFSCLDVNWYKLQEISKWYAFNPALGYQYDNYSDIEKCFCNYRC